MVGCPRHPTVGELEGLDRQPLLDRSQLERSCPDLRRLRPDVPSSIRFIPGSGTPLIRQPARQPMWTAPYNASSGTHSRSGAARHSRPVSFGRVVRCVAAQRLSPNPARPPSHSHMPLGGLRLGILGGAEPVHLAAVLALRERPSTTLLWMSRGYLLVVADRPGMSHSVGGQAFIRSCDTRSHGLVRACPHRVAHPCPASTRLPTPNPERTCVDQHHPGRR
jgi:hypothetical protein